MPCGVNASKIFLAGPASAVCFARAADVVNADIEPIAVPLETLRQAPQLRVAFEDQYALAFPR